MLLGIVVCSVNNAAWDKNNIACGHLVNFIVYKVVAATGYHVVNFVKVVVVMRMHDVAHIGSDVHSESEFFRELENSHFLDLVPFKKQGKSVFFQKNRLIFLYNNTKYQKNQDLFVKKVCTNQRN